MLLRFIMALAVVAGMATTSQACNVCGNFNSCRYRVVHQQPTVTQQFVEKVVPVEKIGLQAIYNITFPPSPYPHIGGATVYTPSYLDPQSFMSAANSYLERSQAASSRAFSEFSQSANLIIQGQQSVAEIQARTQLMQQITAALTIAPGQQQRLTITAARAADGALSFSTGPEAATLSVPAIVKAKCVSCHSPGGSHAELDLTDLAALDPKWERTILDRITMQGPGRMPKGSSLSSEEIIAFMRASSFCGPAKKE